uniref:C2H2-type domain-containing protein n=1 Tax=Strongyloides papillosus TaxID=174720 RepID=A0A0N5BVV2_STREA
MGTWMNIHKRALPGDSRVTEEEKLAHLINLTKNYLGSSYKVVSTSSKTLVIDGEVDANPHQCQICSTVKPSLVALNHHIAFNHTKKGCDSESIDQEMIERIHCYDRRRYQEKTRKMTELELAEFRERQKFHRKKWEERRTEEERIAKIQRNSKMRAERHKAMTEEERSEFNRKARERNQKKREEVAAKLETLPKDSSEYKQLLEAERVKKEKKAEDHRQRKRKAKEMAASMVLLAEDDEAKLKHDKEMEEKKEKERKWKQTSYQRKEEKRKECLNLPEGNKLRTEVETKIQQEKKRRLEYEETRREEKSKKANARQKKQLQEHKCCLEELPPDDQRHIEAKEYFEKKRNYNRAYQEKMKQQKLLKEMKIRIQSKIKTIIFKCDILLSVVVFKK